MDERPSHPETDSPERPSRLRGLWLLAAISLVGGAAALVNASRRVRFERSWEDLADLDPFPPEADPDRRPAPSVPSIHHELDGPAGVLFADDGGSGEPAVLFVHGLGGSSRQWRDELARLRPERRAVALDLRGHGDSERAGPYGIGEYADDVLAAADELGLDRFVLAGHSLGATVALEAAVRRPGRVAGLLLADPNGDQTKIPRDQLDPFLARLEGDPTDEMASYFRQILVSAEPEVADRVLDDLRSTDPDVFRASLESAFAYPAADALDRYPGPKLTVVSDMNHLPYSLHRLRPELPTKLVVGTSHWLMLDRPEAFGDALDDFLAQAL